LLSFFLLENLLSYCHYY